MTELVATMIRVMLLPLEIQTFPHVFLVAVFWGVGLVWVLSNTSVWLRNMSEICHTQTLEKTVDLA